MELRVLEDNDEIPAEFQMAVEIGEKIYAVGEPVYSPLIGGMITGLELTDQGDHHIAFQVVVSTFDTQEEYVLAVNYSGSYTIYRCLPVVEDGG